MQGYSEYIENLTKITEELYRVLKPTGSFWLNIGDTYRNKKLLGIPWRVAINMMTSRNGCLEIVLYGTNTKAGLTVVKTN